MMIVIRSQTSILKAYFPHFEYLVVLPWKISVKSPTCAQEFLLRRQQPIPYVRNENRETKRSIH